MGDYTVLLWRSYDTGDRDDVVSIPRFVEDQADCLRARYLAWVYELGEARVGGKRIIDHLELRPGFSYWWMTLFSEKCGFAKSPQIDEAIRLMAFDEWARKHNICAICFKSTNKALAECLRSWCALTAARFDWQAAPNPKAGWSRSRRMFNGLPAMLQACVWLIYRIIIRWQLIGVGLQEWRTSGAQVTFFSYLFNLVPNSVKPEHYESRYWGNLPESLRSEGLETNWLHQYFENTALPSAGEAAHKLHEFNRSSQGLQAHVCLDSFMNIHVLFHTLRDWLRIKRLSRQLKEPASKISSDGLVLWPLYAYEWNDSLFGKTAMSNLLLVNLFGEAMRALPSQRTGVYLQENMDWEYALLWSWKASRHGQLIGCPHSTVRYWDLRYFFDPRAYNRKTANPLPMPDKVAVNGAPALQAYLDACYPAADLVEVEALRYLNQRVPKGKLDGKIRKTYGTRLLVLGSFSKSDTEAQMRLLEEAVGLLPAGFMTITVKPHPGCQIRPADYLGLSIHLTMDAIENLLAECDVAYSSSVTSAAVDAYCAGVPIVSMLDPTTLNLSPLRGCTGVLFASTPKALATALQSAAAASGTSCNQHNFFTIDSKLPRWRKLLADCLKQKTTSE